VQRFVVRDGMIFLPAGYRVCKKRLQSAVAPQMEMSFLTSVVQLIG